MLDRIPILDGAGRVVNVVNLASDAWEPGAGLKIGPLGGEIGDTWSGSAYIKSVDADLRTLNQLKAELCAEVDAMAEYIRTKYATTQAGLAMTYQEKFAQANAVDAMGQDAANALTPEQMAASFPILAASVGIESDTLWGVAQIVITKYQQWSQLAALIERTRLMGKRDINAASTREAAQAVYGALTWPA